MENTKYISVFINGIEMVWRVPPKMWQELQLYIAACCGAPNMPDDMLNTVEPSKPTVTASLSWSKGDKGRLKESKREFEVVDEKNEEGEYWELLKFKDSMKPEWIMHKHLTNEKDVEKK